MEYYIAKTFTDEDGREILLSITKFPGIRNAKTALRRIWKFQRRKNLPALPDELFYAEFLSNELPGFKKRYKSSLRLDVFEQYEDFFTSSYTSYILFPSKFLMHFEKLYGTKNIRRQKCNVEIPCTSTAIFDEDIPD